MKYRFAIFQVLGVVVASGLLLAAAAVSAQEQPLTRTAKDPSLKWSSCPEFMPKGCQIAVLHGDPSKENADILFKVPANATIPRHWHTSAERIVSLAGELQVTYDGQKPTTLKPGTYAYGPAKLPHSAKCSKAGECILFIAFETPVDAVANGDTPKK
ncbi:MAG: cupin domain-containing protein [Gammaproteobacteria bacterium]